MTIDDDCICYLCMYRPQPPPFNTHTSPTMLTTAWNSVPEHTRQNLNSWMKRPHRSRERGTSQGACSEAPAPPAAPSSSTCMMQCVIVVVARVGGGHICAKRGRLHWDRRRFRPTAVADAAQSPPAISKIYPHRRKVDVMSRLLLLLRHCHVDGGMLMMSEKWECGNGNTSGARGFTSERKASLDTVAVASGFARGRVFSPPARECPSLFSTTPDQTQPRRAACAKAWCVRETNKKTIRAAKPHTKRARHEHANSRAGVCAFLRVRCSREQPSDDDGDHRKSPACFLSKR